MSDEQPKERGSVEEVTARNVAGMRELLDRKALQAAARGAEPPSDADPNQPTQEDPLADDGEGNNGSTGGIRNMGGGRP